MCNDEAQMLCAEGRGGNVIKVFPVWGCDDHRQAFVEGGR